LSVTLCFRLRWNNVVLRVSLAANGFDTVPTNPCPDKEYKAQTRQTLSRTEFALSPKKLPSLAVRCQTGSSRGGGSSVLGRLFAFFA
jgi:hypothetical protein